MKFDAYQMVTDRICALLDQGIKPWAKPWKGIADGAWSGNNGNEYSLLNQILLADPEKKYSSMEEIQADIRGEWVTFHQALERGGCVRKGEKGRKIVFFKMIEVEKDGQEKPEVYPCLNVYTVFKVSQCDGIEQKYHKDDDKLYDFTANLNADEVASGYIFREGITFRTQKSNKACYTPLTDTVTLPLPEQFANWEEYYSTLFHELTHSTGHPKRLNRISEMAAFDKADYSREELVAEIGSASLCATLGIESSKSFTNSAAYISGWLSALKNNKRMIVWAASRAEKAVRMILGLEAQKDD